MDIPAVPGFRSRLRQAIADCIEHNDLPPLPKPVIAALLDVGDELRGTPLDKLAIPFPKQPPDHLDEDDRDQWEELTLLWELEGTRLKNETPPILENAIIESLTAYVKHWPGSEHGPFSFPYAQGVDFPAVVYEMTALLRDAHLKEVGAFGALREAFNKNVKAVTARQLKGKRGDLVYPQDYTGPARTIADAYLAGTPYLALLKTNVPLALYDKSRFETHWIRGEPGTGKSTFLSNLINYDLQRVRRGCSIIIMDSQGAKGLAQNVAKLPVFGPGGELEGRLVYISPRQYAVALNPFRLKRKTEEFVNGSVALFEYVLGGIADAQLTSLQAGATRKILHDLFTSPRADLDMLERAIVEAKDIPKQTKDGIVSRFTTMRSIPAIDRMLNAEENKLDIEHELAQGKVICIDADNGFFRDESLTEIYARIFTALILQATQERTDIPEHRLMPTFFYLDEAQDFIARDDKVAKIIYQARKQHLGMVIANHNETQIEAPAVRAALHSSRIFSRCIKPGQAELWLREQHRPIELTVDPIDLIKAPKNPHWDSIVADQKERYGATPRDEPPMLPDSV